MTKTQKSDPNVQEFLEIVTKEMNDAISDLRRGFTSPNEDFKKYRKAIINRASEIYNTQAPLVYPGTKNREREIEFLCFFINLCEYSSGRGELCTSERIPYCGDIRDKVRSYLRHGFIENHPGKKTMLEDINDVQIREN